MFCALCSLLIGLLWLRISFIPCWRHLLIPYWKWKSLSCVQLLSDPMGLYSPWNSPGQNTGVGSLSLLQESSQPRIKPSSALQTDSLPAEPQGKPKNTRVGSLSLLQRIFQTQELSRGLLYCRWILYQLSYLAPWSQGYGISPNPILMNKSCHWHQDWLF